MEPRDARFAQRDSAFSMQIPVETDGPTRPIPICDRFFVLSNSRTIEIVTADSIDKERKNPGIPHTNRVIFEYGLKDEFINRSLVQFSVLAGKAHPPRTSKKFQYLVWDLTLILGRIEDIYRTSKSELLRLENEVDQWIELARGPAICDPVPQSKLLFGNMKDAILETNEIANKVEQYLRSEMEAGILKQQPKRMSFFDFFRKLNNEQLQHLSDMKEIVMKLGAFFGQAREIRNALLHSDQNKWVKYHDCRLDSDNQILMPAVEVQIPAANISGDYLSFVTQCRQNAHISVQELIAMIAYVELGKTEQWGLKFFQNDTQNGNASLYRFTLQFGEGNELPIG